VNQADDLKLSKQVRGLLLLIAFGGLVLVFVFQRTINFSWVADSDQHANLIFSINRFLRLLLNDLFMIVLLAAWFNDRSVLKLAFFIQLIDLFILLPIYLVIKLTVEGDEEISSPLLSQFHRLIVNPTLMILLIPAIYFQRQLKTHA
jgi:exosortase F-associated protein